MLIFMSEFSLQYLGSYLSIGNIEIKIVSPLPGTSPIPPEKGANLCGRNQIQNSSLEREVPFVWRILYE